MRPSISSDIPRRRQSGKLAQDRVQHEVLAELRRRSLGAAPGPSRPHVRHQALSRPRRSEGARAWRALRLHQGLRRQKRKYLELMRLFEDSFPSYPLKVCTRS